MGINWFFDKCASNVFEEYKEKGRMNYILYQLQFFTNAFYMTTEQTTGKQKNYLLPQEWASANKEWTCTGVNLYWAGSLYVEINKYFVFYTMNE